MFPMTITIHNSSQLAGVLAAMAADDPSVTKAALLAGVQAKAQESSTFKHPSGEPAATKETTAAGKSSTAAVKQATAARTQPSAEAAAAAAPESSDEASPGDAPQGVTFAQARDLVLKLAKAGKREQVAAINAKHGIPKLGALLANPEDLDSVTDQAKLDAIYAELVALDA